MRIRNPVLQYYQHMQTLIQFLRYAAGSCHLSDMDIGASDVINAVLFIANYSIMYRTYLVLFR